MLSGELELRRARVQDAADIAAIHRASWLSWSELGLWPAGIADAVDAAAALEAWRKRLVRDEERTWVWQRGADVIGFARAGHSRDDDAAQTTGELCSMHLSPHDVGTGLGGPLLREALKWLASEHYRSVTLWTLSTNLRAQGFYAHAGFEPDGRTRHFDFKSERILECRYRRALA